MMNSDSFEKKPAARFAADFRRIREAVGLTVQEIHVETRIPVDVLNRFERTGLIEDKSFNRVYLRAIVKSYAEMIDVEESVALRALEEAVAGAYDGSLIRAYQDRGTPSSADSKDPGLQAPVPATPAPDSSPASAAGPPEEKPPSVGASLLSELPEPSPADPDYTEPVSTESPFVKPEPAEGAEPGSMEEVLPEETPEPAALEAEQPEPAPEREDPAPGDPAPGDPAPEMPEPKDPEPEVPEPEDPEPEVPGPEVPEVPEPEVPRPGDPEPDKPPPEVPETGPAVPPKDRASVASAGRRASTPRAWQGGPLRWIIPVVALALVAVVVLVLRPGAAEPDPQPAVQERDTVTTAALAAPPEPEPVRLGDSLATAIVGLQRIERIKVKVDDGLLRHYWIEAGDSLVLRFADRLRLEHDPGRAVPLLDRIQVRIEGQPYSIEERASPHVAVITRDQVRDVLERARQ